MNAGVLGQIDIAAMGYGDGIHLRVNWGEIRAEATVMGA
jgi:hypothetical protein